MLHERSDFPEINKLLEDDEFNTIIQSIFTVTKCEALLAVLKYCNDYSLPNSAHKICAN